MEILLLVVAAAASSSDGQLVIAIGAVATLVATLSALVMLGPNRRSKAMEIAEKGIEIALKRAEEAEAAEADAKADLVVAEARIDALERTANRLRARLREAGLDDT